MRRYIMLLTMVTVLGSTAQALPDGATKPVMVNLQVELDHAGDLPGLNAILGAVEDYEWNVTVYVTGECATSRPEIVNEIDKRGHQLGVLEGNLTGNPFAVQLEIIQKDFKAVLDAVDADRPEYVGEFRSDWQNVDTFHALQELNIRTSSGLQVAGGITRPFHTSYGFITIPLSTAYLSAADGGPVALADKEVLVRLGRTADVWQALLIERFNQCLATHEPMAVVVNSSLTGQNAQYLHALEGFLRYVSEHNGFVALTDDIKSLANPYIEDMTVTGPRTGTPGQNVTLTVTYRSTCWCPHYYFKAYGRTRGEWWNDWLGDLTGWTELNAQVFYPYYGVHSFSVPVTLPCVNGTYLVRVVGRGAHSMYNAWPTAYVYEAIAHWSIDVASDTGATEVGVKNGLAFFEPEPTEQRIPHPVFARGGQAPRFEVRGGAPTSATVDITDSMGRDAATVQISISGSGPWTADWDWSSDLWTDVSGIPAGLYRATFHTESSCGVQPDEPKSFYVIFNPNNGPGRFGFDETAIWFGASEEFDGTWWRGEDAGITYALHPDDNRVFGKAISAVSGRTNVVEATRLLFDLETGLFGYVLSQQANDVLALLEKSEAQCADDASMLCALLRSVGIPAHPTTADANLVRAGWTFDTWVEALTGTEWAVYHPHEGWGPKPRREAAQEGVACKEKNDIIIMAGPNWLSSDVVGYDFDAAFRFFAYGADNQMVPAQQGEGRPLPGFDMKQPWLTELSVEYWGVPHEDPPGPADNPTVLLAFDQPSYAAGQTVVATVTIENGSATPVSGTLDFSLVADDSRSTLWPDFTLMTEQSSLTVGSGATESRTYTYVIAGNADATLLYQGIALWNGARASRTFHVSPLFAAQVESPASVLQFDPFTLKVTASNPTAVPIRQLSCSLVPSYELELKTADAGAVDLSPGASIEFEWTLMGRAVSEVAQAEILLHSIDGGSNRMCQRISVFPGPSRPDLAIDQHDVLLLPGIPRTNARQDFVVTVHNYGHEACTGTVAFTLDNALAQAQGVSLEPDASCDLQFTTVFSAGTHVITIAADPEEAVAESDESNNVWTREFRVGLPDFTVEVTQLIPADPLPGQPLTVYATVFNRGSQPDRHMLDLQLLADGQAIWSTTIDLWSLGYEAPLYTWPIQFAVQLPQPLLDLVLVADPLNVFEEWDETNNEASIYVVPRDTTPPVVTVEVSPSVIWPPNHQYVLVTPSVVATDDQDPSPAIAFDSVMILEEAKVGTFDSGEGRVLGAGHTQNDVLVSEGNIYVRAERAGTGTERRYVITYRATDASGNTAYASGEVRVPHDLSDR